jgi:putative heme-binding domain-containing protein
VSAGEALRGPFLGNIATIYKRDELARAILVPNNTIAQGFGTHHFELKDGTEVDGFVVQEAADKVTVRNVAAQELQFKTDEIAARSKLKKSLMPEGLVANLTLKDFASLLDYLQSLSKQ